MPLVTKRPVPEALALSKRAAALLEPIDEKHAEGTFDEDNEAYLILDDEMIKFGGLQHSSINWELVGKQAQTYLKEQCKHLRITGHLINCWLRQKHWFTWVDSSLLLAGFIDLYYANSYPKPGAKGLEQKRKIATMLLGRLKTALDELAENASQDKSAMQTALQSVLYFHTVAEQQKLGEAVLAILASIQTKLKNSIAAAHPSPNAPKVSPNQGGGQALNQNFFASSHHPANAASASSERETRKLLLNIAEAANLRDAYDPVGYMIRRYAMWSHINSTPIVKRDRLTELMPIAQETAQYYQEALDNNRIDPALLQRVEKSITSSTYWFKGSYYAYHIASKLDMNEAAEAIRLATVRFIRRIPMLMELQFSDGQPFVDEATHDWISMAAAPSQPQAPAPLDHDYAELQQQLQQQLQNEGVEAVLLSLQNLQTKQQASPRKQCHIMKIAAGLLAERGLTWLSDEIYHRIENQMNHIVASEWEPELYQQVSSANE